jgi:hypothetical protein
MKLICAMMLAGAFLISRPVLAGDDAPKTDKAAKSAKKSDKKDAKPEVKKPEEKKADKGGW